MGFNSVYRVLLEVFPQVDSRMLRAVAIEHSKDADVAVEAVIVEVIPYLSKQSLNGSPSNKKSLHGSSEALDGDTAVQSVITFHTEPVDVIPRSSIQFTEDNSSDKNGSLASPSEALDASSCGQPDSPTIAEPVNLGSLDSPFQYANSDTDFVCEDDIDGDPLSLKKSGGKSKIDFDGASSAMVSVSVLYEAALQGDITTMATKNENTNLHVDVEESNQLLMPIVPASSQLEFMPDTQLAVTEKLGSSSSSKAMSKKDASAIEMVNPEDETTMNSVITRSDQICSTELLEDIIEDARNNKKTLVSTMDSVMSLMREVECKEKAAEEAKEEAARGCLDILVKVDELKQALSRAKEANDMHAGEVYAEKAILATELKELQLRLLGLSEERDRSLGILDEMRRALEMRLAESLKEIEAAEKVKLEKEQSAREALAFQEIQMEKVVEESKRLKLEAEENSKLQEFLMDRGRAIDVLQGEIFVKCQDVKLLKEKFDKGVPLGRSQSSSHTSSLLASSSSSFRSVTTPDPEPDTPKKNAVDLADSYGFLDKSLRLGVPHSPQGLTFNGVFGAERQGEDGNAFLDDGWELFDKADLRLDA